MSDLVTPELVDRLNSLSKELIMKYSEADRIARVCSITMDQAAKALQQVLDNQEVKHDIL